MQNENASPCTVGKDRVRCGKLKPAADPKNGNKTAVPRLRLLNRHLPVPVPTKVEQLVAENHPVRAIWEFVCRLDLTGWESRIRAVEGRPGRPPWNPRITICLWLWGCAQGIGSAREISRRCSFDPPFMWLAGGERVNYHTMNSVRAQDKNYLDQLFVNALGVLSAEGLVTLEKIMHDGTKVKANAGSDTFRSRGRIELHLQEARRQIEELDASRDQATNARKAATGLPGKNPETGGGAEPV